MAKIKKIDDELKLASQGVKTATDNFNNMSYDNFKQGSMYQGLQKSYSQQGQQAMKDTLGQVAARTGGMASSYATTAANQSYNNYIQQLEDVARAMYNDEYSKARDKVSLAQNEYDRLYGEKRDAISDQRYEDEQAYLRGRDELSDQRYKTERDEARVANDAYYGNDLDYATYQANGGTLSKQAYNSIVAAAKGKYTDDHYEQDLAAKATRDAELKGILGAEGFLWGDWNGDGIVGDEGGKTFEDIYGGSSYGEDYWKAYAADAQKTHKIAGYKYQNTAEGAAGIVTALTKGANFSLNEEDQENFDYIYGEGAYETTKNAIDTAQKQIRNINIPNKGERYEQGGFLNDVESAFYHLAEQAPWLNEEQIFMLLEKMNPKAMQIYANAEDYFGEPASVYGYDKNGRAIYAAG